MAMMYPLVMKSPSRGPFLSLALVAAACAISCSDAEGIDTPNPGEEEEEEPGPVRSVPEGHLERGAAGCTPIGKEEAVSVDGYNSDVYTFHDATCAPRKAALVRNDEVDPGNTNGGFMRQYTYRVGDATRVCNGSDGYGENGFGYVVSHFDYIDVEADWTENHRVQGTYRTVLLGKHHAIHEFKTRLNASKLTERPLDVTVHWMFATGRSHPIYAITYDSSPSGRNAIIADSRAPFSDMAFDGDPDADVEGIGWGDKYLFRTTGDGPVTQNSSWDYTKPNVVPHVVMWSKTADAEMGSVQTQTFDQQIAGGDYGKGQLGDYCWGRTSENAPSECIPDNERMPQSQIWPFQLNQYQLQERTNAHVMAWGSTYGSVGQEQVESFGKVIGGYPFMSYSVFVVFGQHSANTVVAQTTESRAPPARPSRRRAGRWRRTGRAAPAHDSVPRTVAGFDPTYFTWDVEAENGAATIQLATGTRVLDHPIVRVLNYTSSEPPARVRVTGDELVAETDYFATVDTATKTLWLTLNGTIQGLTTVEIE